MIDTYVTGSAAALAAIAAPGNKNILIDGSKTIIRSGASYIAPPALMQDEQDAAAARSYAKLKALTEMTPAQVQTWVAANVTNLAQAQDAIATLAIAVSVLGRRL